MIVYVWVISNFEIIGHSDISVQITLEGIELEIQYGGRIINVPTELLNFPGEKMPFVFNMYQSWELGNDCKSDVFSKMDSEKQQENCCIHIGSFTPSLF